MEKNQNDADRHDETDRNQPNTNERLTGRTPNSKLVMNQLTVDKPTQHNTRQESTRWQHVLGRQIITEVHQRQAQYLDISVRPHREGTEHGHRGTDNSQYPCGPLTRPMQFLQKEGRADLMHRDGRCQGSKYQQGIEQDRNEIAHGRHRDKRLLEYVRQSDEDERRTTVRLHTYGESRREDHQSGEDGDSRIEQGYLCGRAHQIGVALEIGSISAKTGCSKT